MPQVKIIATAPTRVAFVDGSELEFSADDTFEGSVTKGEHALQWFVRGNKNNPYAISIFSPPNAASALVEIKGKLDASRKDAGTYWFVL